MRPRRAQSYKQNSHHGNIGGSKHKSKTAYSNLINVPSINDHEAEQSDQTKYLQKADAAQAAGVPEAAAIYRENAADEGIHDKKDAIAEKLLAEKGVNIGIPQQANHQMTPEEYETKRRQLLSDYNKREEAKRLQNKEIEDSRKKWAKEHPNESTGGFYNPNEKTAYRINLEAQSAEKKRLSDIRKNVNLAYEIGSKVPYSFSQMMDARVPLEKMQRVIRKENASAS